MKVLFYFILFISLIVSNAAIVIGKSAGLDGHDKDEAYDKAVTYENKAKTDYKKAMFYKYKAVNYSNKALTYKNEGHSYLIKASDYGNVAKDYYKKSIMYEKKISYSPVRDSKSIMKDHKKM